MKKTQFLLFLFLIPLLFSCQKEQIPQYDVCVYGGTSAGVIAAYSAKMMGKTVLLVEPRVHLGGLSSSGLGATDIGNKYAIGGISRDFYRRLGSHYGQFESWTFEPHVAEAVFEQYIQEAQIEVLRRHRLVSATVSGGEIEEILLENSENPTQKTNKTVRAKVFIDCTYEGDLLAKAGVSYTVGREDNSLYGETLNGVQPAHGNQIPDGIDPYIVPGDSTSGLIWGVNAEPLAPAGTGDKKVQAYNYRLCLTQDSTNQIPFSKPENYDSQKYEILYRIIKQRDEAGWVQRLDQLYFRIIEMPNEKTDVNNKGGFSTDYIGGNWNYPEADYETRKKIEQEHREYIEGLLYFMSHDERLPEHVREQMNSWGFAKDEFADNGGFPFQMYVREARRMIGQYVMTEHNCRGDSTVTDAIGMGAYNMDSHNCQRVVINGMVKNEGDVQEPVAPYDISYRALTPKPTECKNLLVPVCLSASHIAYGSIRMEPVFMMLGQASGMAAAMAAENNIPVQEIDVKALQERLANDPLLNGTKPDILIDNAEAKSIEVTGDWETRDSRKQYKKDFLLAKGQAQGERRVRFFPKFQYGGAHKIYLYIPGRGWREENQFPLTQSIEVIVKHPKGVKDTVVSQEANRGGWIDLGEFNFNKGKCGYIEIRADTSTTAVAADAVLLVPSQIK